MKKFEADFVFVLPCDHSKPGVCMEVHVHKVGLMQDVLKHVGIGYTRHFGGIVPVTKVEAFATRMQRLYRTDLSAAERVRRKALGRANAALFLYPRADRQGFDFIGLLTAGEHVAAAAEMLSDAGDRRQRIRFEDRYELLRLTASGGQVRWTWRLTQAAFDAQAAAIRAAVRRQDDDRSVHQVIADLYAMPGFRGVRTQMAGLLRVLHGEWQRSRQEARCPYVSTRPKGYVRFLAIRKMPLSEVVDRMVMGRKPIPYARVHEKGAKS
ncbi:hypothetical protein P7L65_05670 (plasmid) [Tistrella mobilis]|uniref:hypothetical protein n=1 Tax=Tistrella mobilis TaxID=171437 RepID=UPI0035578E8A